MPHTPSPFSFSIQILSTSVSSRKPLRTPWAHSGLLLFGSLDMYVPILLGYHGGVGQYSSPYGMQFPQMENEV